MSVAATRFHVCLSILLLCFILVAECSKCPVGGFQQEVDFEACSSYKGDQKCLRNTFASFFGLSDGSSHEKTVHSTDAEDVCSNSEVFLIPSTLYGCRTKSQCSRVEKLDVKGSASEIKSSEVLNGHNGNASWSSDAITFRLIDGGFVSCSLSFRELGNDASPSTVNNVRPIVLSSSQDDSLCQDEASSASKNIEIEKSQSSHPSFHCVNISPSKLHWPDSHLYHPSVTFLQLTNTCNHTDIEVFEPFSTDIHFYSFNFSEVVLRPGEVTLISFIFLPKRLGLSRAELVLQTSIGGFLVEAKGFAIDSPHRLRPVVGLDVSSGGWLSKNLSLLNPYNETVHLEVVTAWVSISESSGTLVTEAICRKQSAQDCDDQSFSNAEKVSSFKDVQYNSVVMKIRHRSNWIIGPHRSESIVEMSFSPDSQGQVTGAVCMQLLNPLDGKKDTLVIPFEAELKKIANQEGGAGLLSVHMEAVGCCHLNETTVSVSVRNSASQPLKIVRISESVSTNKLLKIVNLEGLLLFPGTVTHVALVTPESANAKYDLFRKTEVSMSCVLQILTNDSISPLIEVSCYDIFNSCSGRQQDFFDNHGDFIDFSRERKSCNSDQQSRGLLKALGHAEVDEFGLQNWRGQRIMSGFSVLDYDELFFPRIPIGMSNAKSVTVRNPSQQPVIVQLILIQGKTRNCQTHCNHLEPPSTSNFIHPDAARPSSYGFSMVESARTEAYLHPNETATLGPILFHPSNRCEWQSLMLVRNNLSGVDMLSLRGFGGMSSLVLLEDSELVQAIDFKLNLQSLNMSPPGTSPNTTDTSHCRNPLSKKLIALNNGDFPINVKSIRVSGAECKLDGFVVQECKSFSLEPGESSVLGISFYADFSSPVVQRDLELVLATGIHMIPMKVALPHHMVQQCRISFFWVRLKRFCATFLLFAIIMSFLLWLLIPQITSSDSVEIFIDGETKSILVKKSTLRFLQGKKLAISARKGFLKSAHRDEAAVIASLVTYAAGQLEDLKPRKVAQITDPLMEGKCEITPSSDAQANLKSVLVDNSGQFKVVQHLDLSVNTRKDKRKRQRRRKGAASGLISLIEVSSSQSGNSTPSSPLSPVTTLQPESHPSSPKEKECQDSPDPVVCVTSNNCDEEVDLGHDPTTVPMEAIAPVEDFRNSLVSLGSRKTSSKSVLLPSATFPGTGRSTSDLWCPSSSGLAISPQARAPGPKTEKATQVEKQGSVQDRFTYDIWGNHFSALLMARRNDPSAMPLCALGNSNSFFQRGPPNASMSNCSLRYVSSSTEGG